MMKGINFEFIAIIIALTFVGAFAQFHGDACFSSTTNQEGRCEYLDQCEQAKLDYGKGIRPHICSFEGRRLVVCCTQSVVQQTQEQSTQTNFGGSSDGQRKTIQKCEEYKKLVLREVTVGSLLLNSKGKQTLSLPNCKINMGTSLIVNGEKTRPGEFPHMAAIGWTEFGVTSYFCGGVLISERFVLTAAHCMSRQRKRPDTVLLGEQNLRSDNDNAKPQKFGIEGYIRHPQYKPATNYYDVGLLKLDRNVVFTDFVRPACLWSSPKIDETTVTATGWGLLEFRGSSSEELQKVSLTLLENDYCDSFFETIKKYGGNRLKDGIVNSQVCAAAVEGGKLVGGKDTCEGDSGGPLQFTLKENHCVYYVVGLTSFSAIGCGSENSPGVYTRVSSYLDWIEQYVWV